VPLKESVKPRGIQIETQVRDQKHLVGAPRPSVAASINKEDDTR
jgi:hypothetical protein